MERKPEKYLKICRHVALCVSNSRRIKINIHCAAVGIVVLNLAGRNRRQQQRLSCPSVIMELRCNKCTFSDTGTLRHPTKGTACAVGLLKG